jgi:hypothetical protein
LNWTTPTELRAQVQRLWARGRVLASVVDPDSATFPYRLQLKRPTSRELSECFESARAWVAALRATPHLRIEMRDIRHRVLGNNAVPSAAWIDSADAAARFIGERPALEHFRALCATTRTRSPRLLPWLAREPLKALALYDDWQHLLDIVEWFETRDPTPVYSRQIDLPGIHSKFIESHRGVLSSLLELVLPATTKSPSTGGARAFARRYGLREPPPQIRFRILDPRLELLKGINATDITLTHNAFAQLRLNARRVFITENLVNFLAFPDVADSLVVFGAGYGFESLAAAHWLADCDIHYWGDIDTHGFAILDQLRAHLPDVRSLLMDRETLVEHRPLWGHEPKPQRRDLTRLHGDERDLYNNLRDNRLGEQVRLEQERIGFSWICSRLPGCR